jgi:hypothetical protein
MDIYPYQSVIARESSQTKDRIGYQPNNFLHFSELTPLARFQSPRPQNLSDGANIAVKLKLTTSLTKCMFQITQQVSSAKVIT